MLLVKRAGEDNGEVYHDMKLPGSLIYMDEDLDEAAQRVLYELTGLRNVNLMQFKAFGSKNRTSNPKDEMCIRDRSGSDYCFGCGKPVYECLSTFRCTFAERIEPDDTEKTNSIYLGSRDRTDCCDSTFLGIYLHFFLVRCIGGCMGPGLSLIHI